MIWQPANEPELPVLGSTKAKDTAPEGTNKAKIGKVHCFLRTILQQQILILSVLVQSCRRNL